MRATHDETGMTLVELMAALLILGLILTALANVLVTSLAAVDRQENRVQSHAVANLALEDAKAQRYRNIAICEAEATAAYGGFTFEGSDVVLLPDTDAQCSLASRLVPERTITRGGIDFDIDLAVVWEDDAADGLGAADADGPQDYKRLIADLAWVERGATRTLRFEGRAAPEAAEQPMRTEVTPLVTGLKDASDGATATGQNRNDFSFRAVHREEQTSVKVTWVDRNGATDQVNLVSSDGGFTWTHTVPANMGLFANGETLFTITATDGAGDTTVVLQRALFLHRLKYLTTPAVPSTIEVLPDGTACGFDLTSSMMGMLLSDAMDVTLSPGPAEAFPLTGTTQTIWGADFSTTIEQGTLLGAGGQTLTVTFSATRVNDPPLTPVTTSVTSTLTEVAACS